MKRKIIKGITLTLFLTLIGSFVAYRSGYFGGMKSTYPVSPNGSALNNQLDTIPQKDSTKRIEIMPSSKVMILKEPTLRVKDTSKTKTTPLIHSSKSGIIMKQGDLKTIKADSIVIDSLKK